MHDFIENMFVYAILPLAMLLLFSLLIGAPIGCYMSASQEAKIINQIAGTHYTAIDMLLAGETIKSQITGNKLRIEAKETILEDK